MVDHNQQFLGPATPEEFDETAWLEERRRIFRFLVPGFFTFIAAVFGLILWVADSPDAYREHEAELAQQHLASAPRWPDGSLRDSDTVAADRQLAEQPGQN